MAYRKLTLHQDFVVDQIISIHYFEYFKDFSFEGERHDFWEFLCVDKGSVSVMAGNHVHQLVKGDIIFHKPEEFHNVKANGVSAPNLVVISFSCESAAIRFFQEKILTVDEVERNLLATIVAESKNAFSTPLGDPYTTELLRLANPVYGSEQLIKIHIEYLLIHLYRRYLLHLAPSTVTRSTKTRQNEEIFNRITDYMDSHISAQLSIEQICHDNLIGRSQLQKLFREKCHCGVIDYFSQRKITQAKRLIREKSLNFTQIADAMGYTSVHYFSRQFKKITGMTPSEYASSIKLLSEKPDSWNSD